MTPQTENRAMVRLLCVLFLGGALSVWTAAVIGLLYLLGYVR